MLLWRPRHVKRTSLTHFKGHANSKDKSGSVLRRNKKPYN